MLSVRSLYNAARNQYQDAQSKRQLADSFAQKAEQDRQLGKDVVVAHVYR